MADGLETKVETERERLDQLIKDFRADWEADRGWRRKADERLDFYNGRQWTEQEKEELERRGQPATVRNRIKPKVDAMVGVELALKVDTKAMPRGAQDFHTARVLSESLRLIEDDNDFDTVEAKAFSSMLKTGRSWYITENDWIDFEAFTTTRMLPVHDVVPDRHGREDDLSDYMRVHQTFFMELKEAKAMWPDHAEIIETALTAPGLPDELRRDQDKPTVDIVGDQYNQPDQNEALFFDKKKKRLRIVRTFYRTNEVKKFLTHPELGTEEITDASEKEIVEIKRLFSGAQVWKDVTQKMNVVTFVGNAILEEQLDTRPFDAEAKFPITLVPGWWDEIQKHHVGIVDQLMDAQREVNKRGSKMLHLLNVNQIEMEDGAVEDINRTREEAARPDGVIIKRKGFAFARDKNLDVATSQFQLLQEAKGEIDAAGAANELLGQSKASSGREFELRQQAAIQPIRELFLNLRGARRRVGLLWLDDIQQYWRSERLVKLTDEPEDAEVVLNQRVIDPITGQITIENDVSVGKYDIKIEEARDTPTLQAESFDALISLANSGVVPIPPEMIIEMSPFPHKKRLLDQLQQQRAAAVSAEGGAPQAAPPGRG